MTSLTQLPRTVVSEVAGPFRAEFVTVRVDSGVEEDGTIGVYYDPMIAKLIVHASDRQRGLDRMARALREFLVLGVKTSIPLHRWLVTHPDVRSGNVDTTWLEREWSPTLLNSLQWINRTFPGFFLMDNRVVPSVGLAHWTGLREQSIYQHQVLRLDGQAAWSTRDIADQERSRHWCGARATLAVMARRMRGAWARPPGPNLRGADPNTSGAT